jgi:F420-0:gamma-glutamyl ligase
MIVTPIKTDAIRTGDCTVEELLDRYIQALGDFSIVVVTSKIVSLCQRRVAKREEHRNKESLVEKHADYYLPKRANKYNYQLTVTNSTLIASAGIDESNGDGHFVLWPKNPQQSANKIREHLRKKWRLEHVGVIITDSASRPLRRGTVGIALAHSGFLGVHDYRNTSDVFNKKLTASSANIAEGLAAAAVVTMGEGDESTPIATIEDVPFVTFQKRNPTDEECEIYRMKMDDDVFSPLLAAVPWQSDK